MHPSIRLLLRSLPCIAVCAGAMPGIAFAGNKQSAETQTHTVNLTFSHDTIFRDTGSRYVAWDTANLSVSACNLRFAGYWFSWDTHWRIQNGGKIVVDSAARLNNNEDNLIFARTFWAEGSGTGTNVIEFDAGFKADHMNYNPPNLSTWTNCGLSLIQFDRVEVITNSSQNLATVYKKCWNDTVSHHGLWLFGKDTTNANGDKWTVRTNDQEYDGGITWLNPLTLVTEKNLTIKGMNNQCVSINFGSNSQRAAVLIKKGPGALVINGTQGYNRGSSFDIQEGTVSFGTDPGDTGAFAYGLTSGEGQYLTVNISTGASVRFLNGATLFDWDLQKYFPPVTRNRIYALNSRGLVTIGNGIVEVATGFTFQVGAEVRFQKVASGTSVKVAGTATCAGKLTVDTLPTQPGDYDLISAATVSGSFSITSLPQSGVAEVVYQPDKVILRVTSSAARTTVDRLRSAVTIRTGLESRGRSLYSITIPTKAVAGTLHAALVTATGATRARVREIKYRQSSTEIIFESTGSRQSAGPCLLQYTLDGNRYIVRTIISPK